MGVVREGEAKREWWRTRGAEDLVSGRKKRRVAEERYKNQPASRRDKDHEEEPRWFLFSTSWKKMLLSSYEGRRYVDTRVDKNGIFLIDRSSVWSNPCKESAWMFEKEESHWYVTYARAVHGSQSSLRGFVLFYAPQLEADRWDPLSAQVPNRWSPRFLRVTLGRICRDKFRISPIHRQRWSASYYCRRKNSCNYSTTAGFELAMSHRSVEYHRAQNYSP